MVTVPGFCTTVAIGSFLTVKPAGTVATFAEGPPDAVTGAVTGILTVTIVAGVALMGVDTADWEIVRATTGLARA